MLGATPKPGVETPWLYARVPPGLSSDFIHWTRDQGTEAHYIPATVGQAQGLPHRRHPGVDQVRRA